LAEPNDYLRRARERVESPNATGQPLSRRELAELVGAAGGSFAFADLIRSTQRTPVPLVVGYREVAEVRNIAREFAGWDNRYGGGMLREASVAQLQYCVELLNARCSDHVRPELFSAVGVLARITGFIAFDAYAHDEDARRMFRFALNCAEESGDWHLRAWVLSCMARQAICCGDPDTGLTFIELAMVRADRLTASERAILHTGRAQALAKLGRVQEAAAAVGAADEEFIHSRTAGDPSTLGYYDAAVHAGEIGRALADVAVHGHFITEARHHLSTAVTGHEEDHARLRVLSQSKLASLVMATGDPSEAAVIGGQALDALSTIRSRRAADDMRDLRRFSKPHKRITAVAELIHRIGTVVVI
jgi:hypothetical protein